MSQLLAVWVRSSTGQRADENDAHCRLRITLNFSLIRAEYNNRNVYWLATRTKANRSGRMIASVGRYSRNSQGFRNQKHMTIV